MQVSIRLFTTTVSRFLAMLKIEHKKADKSLVQMIRRFIMASLSMCRLSEDVSKKKKS